MNRNKLPVEKWTLIGTVEKDLREGLDLEGTLIWRDTDLEGLGLGGGLTWRNTDFDGGKGETGRL